MMKTLFVDVSGLKGVRLTYRGIGDKNSIEIKLEDDDGSVFGKTLYRKTATDDWTTVEIPLEAFSYWYGGDKTLNDSQLKFHFAICRVDGGKGTVVVNDFEYVK